MAQTVDRQELQIRFLQAINGADYRFIEGLNPFHILLNGTEYWIYIKNLTSAHFTNPEVWRAQLPLRDDFEAIKNSDIAFILLGYDGENDVYATWNPVWVKQRLNSTENVSLYSRYSLQVEARESFELKRMDLGNDGEVVVFPREMTRMFFINVSSYFLNTGDYVAMGSKRRPEANEAFKILTTPANVDRFARHLINEGLSSITTGSYCRIIRSLISEGLFNRYRKVFLQYDSLSEYKAAISTFLELPEIAQKNVKWNNHISNALMPYIDFLSNSLTSENEIDLGSTTVSGQNLPPKESGYQLTQNEMFEHFCSFDSVAQFEQSLFHKVYRVSTIRRYSKAIRVLIRTGLFKKYKDLFLSKTSYSQYQIASDAFFRIPEIREMNEDKHHDYSAAMKQYIEFLTKTDSHIASAGSPALLENSEQVEQEIEHQMEITNRDWEADFTDEKGKLTRIANPELLDRLRPVLDREYPNAASAFNIVEDFYGDRFKEMEFFEWGRLFKEIDWDKPTSSITSGKVNNTPSKKNKSVVLHVELPDGRIVESKNASSIYCEAIKAIGPEEVSILNIRHAGVNIVSRERDPKYAKDQRDIGEGWLVMTNSSTLTKYHDLVKIIQEYGVKMSVSLIPSDPLCLIDNAKLHERSGSRAKIRVSFPDGRTIEPGWALEALVEVVKYAGPERVRDLSIICCADNLILKKPAPRYVKPCKPVGNGWLCNTCSNTQTKYEQIKEISERLNLGLMIKLISD